FAHADQAQRDADASGHEFQRAQARLACGLVNLYAGHVVDAIAALELGHSMVRTGGFDRSMVALTTRALLAAAYALATRREEALQLVEPLPDLGTFLGARAHMNTYSAEALLLAGRLDDARELAELALTEATARGERGAAAQALRLAAEVAACSQPPDLGKARTKFHEAPSRAAAVQMAPVVPAFPFRLGAMYG